MKIQNAPEGHIYMRRGRRMIKATGHWRASSNGYLEEHLVIAEKALGKPLPLTANVHHVNGDKGDNSRGNLVICQDAAYHRLLHSRQRILERGGRPELHRICSRCRELKTKEAFAACASRWDGRANECRACARERHSKTGE